MPATENQSSSAGVVADTPLKLDGTRPRRTRALQAWQHATQHPDAREAELRQRAHRIALALMVGSSVVSILVLAGIWVLLRSMILSAG